jgi:pimeloyl-ACP methyl ester carboxylesterase
MAPLNAMNREGTLMDELKEVTLGEPAAEYPDGPPAEPPARAPGLWLLLLEGRLPLELAGLVAAYPLLRQAPRGDGHPVLVLPAFMASDLSTRVLRRFLRERGYAVHGWKLGRNTGPTPQTVMGLGRRLDELRQRYDRRVSLIGWSLGGVYARELARRFPSDVRQVITLASPFRDLEAHNVPAFLLARRRPHPDESAFREQLRAPLPVPTTAIVSRTDGITPWQSCVAEPGPGSESLEVESSHVGMTHHPVVLLTIADRLAQPEGAWRPFRPPGGWRWPLVPRVLGSGAGAPSPSSR